MRCADPLHRVAGCLAAKEEEVLTLACGGDSVLSVPAAASCARVSLDGLLDGVQFSTGGQDGRGGRKPHVASISLRQPLASNRFLEFFPAQPAPLLSKEADAAPDDSFASIAWPRQRRHLAIRPSRDLKKTLGW